MTTSLPVPKDPKRFDLLPFLEPMRIMYKDKPAIGMKVAPKRFPSPGYLLIIDQDGQILCENDWASCRFIDYLTEDESFTIFGSAGPRSEDDHLTPLPTSGADGMRPSLISGCPRSMVPDFIPYLGKRSGTFLLYSINIPASDGERATLSYRGNSSGLPCWGKVDPTDRSAQFLSYAVEENLDLWRDHPYIGRAKGLEPELWPR